MHCDHGCPGLTSHRVERVKDKAHVFLVVLIRSQAASRKRIENNQCRLFCLDGTNELSNGLGFKELYWFAPAATRLDNAAVDWNSWLLRLPEPVAANFARTNLLDLFTGEIETDYLANNLKVCFDRHISYVS
jgi:hypothetical protein